MSDANVEPIAVTSQPVRQPWFKFFAADYLLDAKVDALPLEARGLLVSMWSVCHVEGSCPANPEEIARKTRIALEDVTKCVPYYVPFFESYNGRLYSHRMEAEKRKSAAARQSVSHRWKQTTCENRNTDRITDRITQSQKSESESESEEGSMVASAPDREPAIAEKPKRQRKQFTPPSLADVQEHCKQIGSHVDPKKFFDYYEASHWHKANGKPVTCWKQCLVTWEQKDGGNHTASPAPVRKTVDFVNPAIVRHLQEAGIYERKRPIPADYEPGGPLHVACRVCGKTALDMGPRFGALCPDHAGRVPPLTPKTEQAVANVY